MKRIFKDADKKYTWHLKRMRKQIKKLHKSQLAWTILVIGIVFGWLCIMLIKQIREGCVICN